MTCTTVVTVCIVTPVTLHLLVHVVHFFLLMTQVWVTIVMAIIGLASQTNTGYAFQDGIQTVSIHFQC